MIKRNEGFICVNCGYKVSPARKTCRNHCPRCFVSLHVDDKIPWDRASVCGWKMYPIDYTIKNWQIKILFKCEKCWKLHWNKAADDDDIAKLPEIVMKYKFML